MGLLCASHEWQWAVKPVEVQTESIRAEDTFTGLVLLDGSSMARRGWYICTTDRRMEGWGDEHEQAGLAQPTVRYMYTND